MAVRGQFTFAGTSVDMNASSDGSTLSGTVTVSYDEQTFSIELQCLRQFDGQTWMLAGVLTKSAVPNQADGILGGRHRPRWLAAAGRHLHPGTGDGR